MSADLKAELARLNGLGRSELMERWRTLYEREPPASISRPLLIHAIAYRMQENVLGSLKPTARRVLAQATTDGKVSISASVKEGTRLLREWHGNTYEVAVLEKEVLFNGRRYRSLTEVARIITGTNWSGPNFFGLRRKNA